MGLFRRREPLHERLAREAGLQMDPQPEPVDPRPPTLETGIHGLHRPRAWDATVTADAEGIDGDEATFVALPDGTLLVEQGPDGSLERAGRRGGAGAASRRTGPAPSGAARRSGRCRRGGSR